MGRFLRAATLFVSAVHDKISSLIMGIFPWMNDKFLHFFVVGTSGIFLVLILYPLFKYLTKKGYYFGITFIYVLTLLTGITFAIEIGQKITGTGDMEFADITAGLLGFLSLFLIFMLIVLTVRLIKKKRI